MALDKETLRRSMLRDLPLLKSLATGEDIKNNPTISSASEPQLVTIANIFHFMAEGTDQKSLVVIIIFQCLTFYL